MIYPTCEEVKLEKRNALVLRMSNTWISGFDVYLKDKGIDRGTARSFTVGSTFHPYDEVSVALAIELFKEKLVRDGWLDVKVWLVDYPKIPKAECTNWLQEIGFLDPTITYVDSPYKHVYVYIRRSV